MIDNNKIEHKKDLLREFKLRRTIQTMNPNNFSQAIKTPQKPAQLFSILLIQIQLLGVCVGILTLKLNFFKIQNSCS